MRQKIMVCGSSGHRVPYLLDRARELGYETVSCYYRPTEWLGGLADTTHQLDLFDCEALLQIAREEGISGIIAAEDPLMHSVNYVAHELGLPGNDVSGIDLILSKSGFRQLQRKAGVFAPIGYMMDDPADLIKALKGGEVPFPIVIKPEQSSSSRATTRIEAFDEATIAKAFETCRGYSRTGMVCVEQFVANREPNRILEIDVFVLGEDILWDGMRYCYHCPDNFALPLMDIYDVRLSESDLAKAKKSISRTLSVAGFVFGEANIESYFTPEGEFFIVEINPRQAGCYNPLFIQQYCGVDLTKLLVSTAVGDMSYWEDLRHFERKRRHTASHTVTSAEEGRYGGLYLSPEIAPHVISVHEDCAIGQEIHVAQSAHDNIAYVLYDFDSRDQMHWFMDDIRSHVRPVLLGQPGGSR